MNFDELLVKLGDFGLYQKRLYLMLCLPTIIGGTYMLMLVFIVEPPEHRCKIPGYPNDTFTIQSESHRRAINLTIPPSSDDLHVYDQCHVYVQINDSQHNHDNSTTHKCSEWVYDKSVFKETFTSKHNLVCDQKIKTSVIQMVFYLGVLFGDLVFGMLADRIGRRKSFNVTIFILLGCGYGAPFAPGFYTFIVLQFFIGASLHANFTISITLCLEMVGPSKRKWSAFLNGMAYGVGLMYLVAVEYLLKDWRWVQIASITPVVSYFVYLWVLPESPRWLINQGRYVEADVLIQKIAKVNKVCIPDNIIESSMEEEPLKEKESLQHVFRSPILCARSLVLFFSWMIVSLCFFGVTMNTGNLYGNFYLDFFLLNLVEFPSNITLLLLLDKVGRRRLYCWFMLIGGVCMICTLFSVTYGGKSLHALTLVLAIVGKFSISIAFGTLILYSQELFPTIVRGRMMGICSCVARFGSMAAPYITQLTAFVGGRFGQALPLIIFGATSIISAVLVLLLPDTLNKDLPETVEDSRNFGRKRNTISTETHIQISRTDKNKLNNEM